MKKTLSITLFATCLVISTHAFGASSPAKSNPAPTAVDASQAAENMVFQGIIKQLDVGTALFTEKQVYPLIGGNFETIVGKEVNIIGKIVKDGDVEKISVARIQFAKN
ncbi:MAG: hypothetical protein GY799_26565 [Desulfobulbaceae bacterium]|nr:hypothetical protein [Desulfobulbaceae bacterium]